MHKAVNINLATVEASIDTFMQTELERLARKCLTNEKLIRAVIAQDIDIHTAKAAELFDKDYTKVTVEQRKAAKQANYFHLYSQPFGQI